MNKTKLFLDYDGVIINSAKAYCDTYNELYQFHPEFKKAIWYENEVWDLKDVAPLVLNCNDIFSKYMFFQKAEFINGNTKEVIEKLCKKYEVIVCSIGVPENISYKSIWLKENLPCIKECTFLCNNHCKMDKSLVDMSNAIFIDDVVSNLDSSNAKTKIIFGDEYEWNKSNKYKRCWNWTDIELLLI